MHPNYDCRLAHVGTLDVTKKAPHYETMTSTSVHSDSEFLFKKFDLGRHT